MKVIGLTGGTGSGKSAVSRFLEFSGAAIVDADLVSRQIVEPGKEAYKEIVSYFGKDIVNADGTLFRRKLGEIVFHDQEKLAFLNQCTHKYIVEEMKRQIEAIKKEGKASCIILDAPLLFEAGLEQYCDEVWVVFADPEVRAKRVMERDGITYELALARIANQKSWKEYQSRADFVIDNSGSLEDLKKNMENILKKIGDET